MDELELDLQGGEEVNRTEQRIKNLSTKVAETAQERDAAKAAQEAAEAARNAAEKKLDFLNSFSDVSAKYQGANEYRSAIEEKVLAGYSVEDATVAVLAKEGKFSPQAAPQQYGNAGGGSAPTQLPDNGSKSVEELSREERREALMQADKEGELARILRNQ